MGHDVFVSYQHEDYPIAKAVCNALEDADLRCWISARNEKPGENWMEALVRGLDESKIVVFILSANSNKSEACRKELAIAYENKMPIIPLQVEDVSPAGDLKYLLAQRQRLEVFARPIDKDLDSLVEAARSLIESLSQQNSMRLTTTENLQGIAQIRASPAELHTCTARIGDPHEGDVVKQRTVVTGDVSDILEGYKLWPVLFVPLVNRYYPQNGPILIKEGRWKSVFFIGSPQNRGDEFEIKIVLASPDAHVEFRRYQERAALNNSWPGIIELPSWSVECDSINVTLDI